MQASSAHFSRKLRSKRYETSTPTIKTDVDVILDDVEKLDVRLMPLVKNNESLLLPFNKVRN